MRRRSTEQHVERILFERSGEINRDIEQAREQRHQAELGAARSEQRAGSTLNRVVQWFDEIHRRNHIVEALSSIFGR